MPIVKVEMAFDGDTRPTGYAPLARVSNAPPNSLRPDTETWEGVPCALRSPNHDQADTSATSETTRMFIAKHANRVVSKPFKPVEVAVRTMARFPMPFPALSMMPAAGS